MKFTQGRCPAMEFSRHTISCGSFHNVYKLCTYTSDLTVRFLPLIQSISNMLHLWLPWILHLTIMMSMLCTSQTALEIYNMHPHQSTAGAFRTANLQYSYTVVAMVLHGHVIHEPDCP